MVERAFLISSKPVFEPADFLLPTKSHFSPEGLFKSLNLVENEKKLIQVALLKSNYDQQLAADYLGISRNSLIRRMKKYRIALDKILK